MDSAVARFKAGVRAELPGCQVASREYVKYPKLRHLSTLLWSLIAVGILLNVGLHVPQTAPLLRQLLPGFIARNLFSPYSVLIFYLALSVMKTISASGAFEVLDAKTGEVLFSRLESRAFPNARFFESLKQRASLKAPGKA